MRQQYHFREVDGKTLIWDVNKLIEKHKGLPVMQISLDEIKEIDEPYWFKTGDTATTRDIIEHMELVSAANLSYPILLCNEGRIIDGMHRVVKAKLLGLSYINAIRLQESVAPDYVDVDPGDLPYDDEL